MTESTNSIYENVDIGGNIFKPTVAGEQIEPTLTEVTREPSKFAGPNGEKKETFRFVGVDEQGQEHIWYANNVDALRQVVAEQPLVGDRVRIRYLGEQPMPGLSPKKLWEIKVLARKGEVELDDDGFPIGF